MSFATYFNAPASYWATLDDANRCVARAGDRRRAGRRVYRPRFTGARIFVEGHDFTGTE